MAKTHKQVSPIIVDILDLPGYCPELATWAQSWCGQECDVIPGEAIVAAFTPSLLDLLAQGLSRKTRNPGAALVRFNLQTAQSVSGCTRQ